MPTLTTHAPSTSTPAFAKRDAPDIEPDDTWKNSLKKRIKEGFASMVKDAKDSLKRQLTQIIVSDADRERYKAEYTVTMDTIRRLAKKQFRIELDRERQERRRTLDIPMHPQWNQALVQEQVEIIQQMKREGGSNSANGSPVEERRPAPIPAPVPAPAPRPPPTTLSATYEVSPLPPQLKGIRQQVTSSAFMSTLRRGSDFRTSSRDRDDALASLRRNAARPIVPDRPPLPETFKPPPAPPSEEDDSTDDSEDSDSSDADDEALLRPPPRTKPPLISPSEMAPIPEVPHSRSIDHVPPSRTGSISERHAHSPPKPIPAIWKPSISPEEDAAASKPFVVIATGGGAGNRRGSTASTRSTGSAGGRRPSIAETIEERPLTGRGGEGASTGVARERGREMQLEAEKAWSYKEKAREREREKPPTTPMRTDNRQRTISQECAPLPMRTDNRQRTYSEEIPGAPIMRTDNRQRTFSEEIPNFSSEDRDFPSIPRSAGYHPPMLLPRAIVPKSSFTSDEPQHRHRPPPSKASWDDPQEGVPSTSATVSRKTSFANNDDRDRLAFQSPAFSRVSPLKPAFASDERGEYQAASPGGHRLTGKMSFSKKDDRDRDRERERDKEREWDRQRDRDRERKMDEYPDPPRQYGSLSSTRPANYSTPPASATPRLGRDYAAQEEFDEWDREGGRYPDVQQGEYQRPGSARPQPNRQGSYSRWEREEFERWQGGGNDDPYTRQPYSASPSIPTISPPRHSPSLEEAGGGGGSSWRDWITNPQGRYEHYQQSSPWKQGSFQSSHQGRHDGSGYHNFGGRDGGEHGPDIDEEGYDSELDREEEEARLKEEEARLKEEDALRKKEETIRKKETEAKKKEIEARKKEAEARLREAEVRIKAEEVKKMAEEEEEAKRMEEEARRMEEARLKEEEARLKEEEALRKKEETIRKKETEAKKKEIEARKKEAEARLQEAEARITMPVFAEKQRELEGQRLKQERQWENPIDQQQEDFRKREDEIKWKRQDSAERSWHSAISPMSSSPSASTKPPQRSGSMNTFANRSSTSNTSTWSSARSGWYKSTKAVPASSTSASSAGRTAMGTPPTKPRARSTSSNSYPTGASPGASTPFSEAEWARRHDEQAKKQQEQFRREQERYEAERQAKSAGGVMTKEELIHLFEMHERLWTNLPTRDQLLWGDFPWPMVKKPSNPEDITMPAISAYILSPHFPEKDKSRTSKDRLKDHLRRWHPDHIRMKFLPKVPEPDREKVNEGLRLVVINLNILMMSWIVPLSPSADSDSSSDSSDASIRNRPSLGQSSSTNTFSPSEIFASSTSNTVTAMDSSTTNLSAGSMSSKIHSIGASPSHSAQFSKVEWALHTEQTSKEHELFQREQSGQFLAKGQPEVTSTGVVFKHDHERIDVVLDDNWSTMEFPSNHTDGARRRQVSVSTEQPKSDRNQLASSGSGELRDEGLILNTSGLLTPNIDASFISLCNWFTSILTDQSKYRNLLAFRELTTQRILDTIQALLDDPRLSLEYSSLRKRLLSALLQLSKKSALYPRCYVLKGIQIRNEAVAAGHYGEIYEGESEGRKVCLKMVKIYKKKEVERLLKAFCKEAIVWKHLSHPNLLPFYGIYRLEDRHNRVCLVSPWMENGNIMEFLQVNPDIARIPLIADILKGISYLHDSEDIIHGDLKGANVLVTTSGRACLADFGLSSVTEADILIWTSISTTTKAAGTTRWIAQELFSKDDEDIKPTKASDIYSFSCTCYEVFTDRIPFHEIKHDASVMAKVMVGQRPSHPSLSTTNSRHREWGMIDTIWNLIESCWHADPAMRPTAKEALDRLPVVVTKENEEKDSHILSFFEFRRANQIPDHISDADAAEIMSLVSPLSPLRATNVH